MKEHIKQLLFLAIETIKQEGIIDSDISINIQIERTRNKQHGEYSSNLAMMLSKTTKLKPRDLATVIVSHLSQSPLIESIHIAGPGFINFSLMPKVFLAVIPDILKKKCDYGKCSLGKNLKTNLEFVSANPVAPLSVVHARTAVYGKSLANLLTHVGYDIHREYYINDIGRHIDILIVSLWLRYLELFNEKLLYPIAAYKGDYLRMIAEKLFQLRGEEFKVSSNELFHEIPQDELPDQTGDKNEHIDALIVRCKKLLSKDSYKFLADFVNQEIIQNIKSDLHDFAVDFDNWFNEKSLYTTDIIGRVIDVLRNGHHVYERDNALWFHSTPFGDEKDRLLIRENGQITYFAADIAYLLHKLERGFQKLIYVLSVEHQNYVMAFKAAAKILGIDSEAIKIILVPFANYYRNQERIVLSKYEKNSMTLRDLYQEINKNNIYFFFNCHDVEAELDFDINKVTTKENPFYYVQHTCEIIKEILIEYENKDSIWQQGINSLMLLTDEHEKILLEDLSRYKEIVEYSAMHYEPQHLTHYLQELAHDFHKYYAISPLSVLDDKIRYARLCLIKAIQQIIDNGLTILGITV